MNNMDGTHYLSELIRNLSENRNMESYAGDFTVTAIVNGKEKVTEDIIKCQFNIRHDSVDVSMFWEDCGYKGFRDMGLYGRTNSNYFTVEELSASSFKIKDNNNSANETIFEW